MALNTQAEEQAQKIEPSEVVIKPVLSDSLLADPFSAAPSSVTLEELLDCFQPADIS